MLATRFAVMPLVGAGEPAVVRGAVAPLVAAGAVPPVGPSRASLKRLFTASCARIAAEQPSVSPGRVEEPEMPFDSAVLGEPGVAVEAVFGADHTDGAGWVTEALTGDVVAAGIPVLEHAASAIARQPSTAAVRRSVTVRRNGRPGTSKWRPLRR